MTFRLSKLWTGFLTFLLFRQNTSSEILLDLDHYTRKGVLHLINSKRWRFLLRYNFPVFGQLQVKHVGVRATWHGQHICLQTVNKIPALLLVFLQTAFGDDVRRSSKNLTRILEEHIQKFNVLFPEKFKVLSKETLDPKLSKKATALVKKIQKGYVHKK